MMQTKTPSNLLNCHKLHKICKSIQICINTFAIAILNSLTKFACWFSFSLFHWFTSLEEYLLDILISAWYQACIICDSRGRFGSGFKLHVHTLTLSSGLPLVNEWLLNSLSTILIWSASFFATGWDVSGGGRSFRTLPISLLAYLCKPSWLALKVSWCLCVMSVSQSKHLTQIVHQG